MSSSDIWLLAVGILAVIVTAALAASTRRAIALGTLIALIPFQVVTTRYASSSVLMAYAMAAVLLITGSFKVRMLPAIGAILLAYFASLTQVQSFLTMHVVEIFQLASCLIVFLLAYNFARIIKSERTIVDLLYGVNIAVIVYCVLQLSAGPGNAFTPFGLDQLAFNSNRDPGDPRLIGPFANPGTTAGYLTLMSLICVVDLVHSTGRRRRLAQILILLNIAGITATGNRATFLVLVAAFPILLLVFRRELGAGRMLRYTVAGSTAVAVMLAVVFVHTGFGNILTRLENVAVTEEGIPATRANTWPVAIEKIKREPWLGEGPHFFVLEDAKMMGMIRPKFEELGDVVTVFDPYPHSLYLFLLRTVGIFGLTAVLFFFGQVSRELFRALGRNGNTEYSRAILKVGMVVIGSFLITQITLEFNRTGTMDYGQFIFALMGLFVGVADRSRPAELAARAQAGVRAEPARV
jgi:O-antigen ligase